MEKKGITKIQKAMDLIASSMDDISCDNEYYILMGMYNSLENIVKIKEISQKNSKEKKK